MPVSAVFVTGDRVSTDLQRAGAVEFVGRGHHAEIERGRRRHDLEGRTRFIQFAGCFVPPHGIEQFAFQFRVLLASLLVTRRVQFVKREVVECERIVAVEGGRGRHREDRPGLHVHHDPAHPVLYVEGRPDLLEQRFEPGFNVGVERGFDAVARDRFAVGDADIRKFPSGRVLGVQKRALFARQHFVVSVFEPEQPLLIRPGKTDRMRGEGAEGIVADRRRIGVNHLFEFVLGYERDHALEFVLSDVLFYGLVERSGLLRTGENDGSVDAEKRGKTVRDGLGVIDAVAFALLADVDRGKIDPPDRPVARENRSVRGVNGPAGRCKRGSGAHLFLDHLRITGISEHLHSEDSDEKKTSETKKSREERDHASSRRGVTKTKVPVSMLHTILRKTE